MHTRFFFFNALDLVIHMQVGGKLEANKVACIKMNQESAG